MKSSNDNKKTGAKLCVVCESAIATETYTPFCSKRCADVDLHRWLSEGYAIPATEDNDEDDMRPPPEMTEH
ncbi:MAG: DNA gyrase inhibitor YacG [Pseudomonadota bacterium]